MSKIMWQPISKRTTVLGYPVDLVDAQQAVTLINQAWSEKKGLHIVTLNAEMIVAAQKDDRLNNILKQANLVVADGAGVVLALKMQGKNISRLPGIELAQLALSKAASRNIDVVLIGGTTAVLDHLRSILPNAYPNLKLVGHHDGYFQASEEQSIIEMIAKSDAQLVLIAMGVPRQEYFIESCQKAMSQTVFIGVGGSFDIWAGHKTRAPAIFRNCNLEWLYRLIKEPWRFRRMGAALPNFAWQIMLDFLFNRNKDK